MSSIFLFICDVLFVHHQNKYHHYKYTFHFELTSIILQDKKINIEAQIIYKKSLIVLLVVCKKMPRTPRSPVDELIHEIQQLDGYNDNVLDELRTIALNVQQTYSKGTITSNVALFEATYMDILSDFLTLVPSIQGTGSKKLHKAINNTRRIYEPLLNINHNKKVNQSNKGSSSQTKLSSSTIIATPPVSSKDLSKFFPINYQMDNEAQKKFTQTKLVEYMKKEYPILVKKKFSDDQILSAAKRSMNDKTPWLSSFASKHLA